MWIVRLALRRPYTFVVVSLLIAILGVAAIITMPVDIFPYIDIPVVSIVWSYNGLSPEEMEKRIVTTFERSMTTTVNDIEHIESQSYSGASVIRVYFQPNAKVEVALSQVTAIAQTFVRTQLATIQGAAVPLPFGGKFRTVMVDLNPDALFAKQLSPADISTALGNQNLILPAGTAKIGDKDYQVKLNSSPRILDEMNGMPIKVVNGATVYLRDVAQVRDGYSVQT